jgi:flap endonuclease-1
MGIQISEIIPKKEIELTDLAGKKIAIDAFNTIFQFLSIIRDRFTGEPLKDSKGRVTSHLSGLMYRTINFVDAGIKPIYVFDGEPPKLKKRTQEKREAIRSEAREKWKEALRKGEAAMKYAQASSQLTDEMLKDAKKLLELMGIPYLQAPSEAEAQCSFMAKKEDVFATGSQDHDALLFGSPRLVKNLSIAGRKKVPNKEVYIELKPELIELKEVLESLGLTQKQLVIMGILIGTDYNEGVKGFGPKRSLEIVREEKTLKNVLQKVKWEEDVGPEEVMKLFLEPQVTEKYEFRWKPPENEKLMKFMVDEHDFSRERVEKAVQKLQERFTSGTQSSLKGFVKE